MFPNGHWNKVTVFAFELPYFGVACKHRLEFWLL